mmetsp:Transcript_5328/g.15911  ORF Transcript_5328/g.15911 Transcript_5328/m.15911 type:complete len:316 (-) Transcript_5328:455-1402(-)
MTGPYSAKRPCSQSKVLVCRVKTEEFSGYGRIHDLFDIIPAASVGQFNLTLRRIKLHPRQKLPLRANFHRFHLPVLSAVVVLNGSLHLVLVVRPGDDAYPDKFRSAVAKPGAGLLALALQIVGKLKHNSDSELLSGNIQTDTQGILMVVELSPHSPLACCDLEALSVHNFKVVSPKVGPSLCCGEKHGELGRLAVLVGYTCTLPLKLESECRLAKHLFAIQKRDKRPIKLGGIWNTLCRCCCRLRSRLNCRGSWRSTEPLYPQRDDLRVETPVRSRKYDDSVSDAHDSGTNDLLPFKFGDSRTKNPLPIGLDKMC